MLGPRTRSAVQRAPRAEQFAGQDDRVDDDERDPKRPKEGARARADEAPASAEAAPEATSASTLYAM